MHPHTANILTLVRLLLVPFFVAAVAGTSVLSGAAALLLFALAAVTDYLDGVVARRYGLQTPLGEFLDPLADKVLVGAAFITFALLPQLTVPLWLVGVILLRELFVTGMRVAGIRKQRRMKTEKAGKVKTAVQMVSILVILALLLARSVLARDRFPEDPAPGPELWTQAAGPAGLLLHYLPLLLTAVSALLALVSLVQYVRGNRHLFPGARS
ncbi:MAG: CDP-diacylglycerol--glycerol-3-phosphate 3-phosphatidyltransferase [Spirochaetota bacterium]